MRLGSCGEGTGFSSEIETDKAGACRQIDGRVARELASHLRLKRIVVRSPPNLHSRGEGTGFSSEIETLACRAA